MPYKHQIDCYRTIGGKRYVCMKDCCENGGGKEALELKKELQKEGKSVRIIKHKDGFRQVFATE